MRWCRWGVKKQKNQEGLGLVCIIPNSLIKSLYALSFRDQIFLQNLYDSPITPIRFSTREIFFYHTSARGQCETTQLSDNSVFNIVTVFSTVSTEKNNPNDRYGNRLLRRVSDFNSCLQVDFRVSSFGHVFSHIYHVLRFHIFHLTLNFFFSRNYLVSYFASGVAAWIHTRRGVKSKYFLRHRSNIHSVMFFLMVGCNLKPLLLPVVITHIVGLA